MIENIQTMSEEDFSAYITEEQTWTLVQRDGTVVPLKPGGADNLLSYEEREEYCALVKEKRMAECDKQVCLGFFVYKI